MPEYLLGEFWLFIYSRNRVILTPVLFCRQVSVKIVLFVIQLENNRIYLSFFCLSGYFVVLAVQSNGQNNPILTVCY